MALNITIGNLNGWILKRHAFGYPVMLTTIHMIVCWVCSGLALQTSTFRPKPGTTVSPALRRKVAGLALAFCLSVTCGNVALRFIYVSFAQMVTAASPLFTMVLMYIATGKRYSRLSTFSMLPMCGGVMMCTAAEINFHLVGFGAVIAATLLRGVKSIVQQRLLTSPEEKLDSMSLLFHMSGPSIVFLSLFSAATEYEALWEARLYQPEAVHLWGLIVLSGGVSFLLNLANFLVTKYTSAIALQVLGNVKVVLSIVISLLIFGNRVSEWSAAGCVVTLLGVAMYNSAPK
jgi:drug/metabolite transporter (DMT)-like permease